MHKGTFCLTEFLDEWIKQNPNNKLTYVWRMPLENVVWGLVDDKPELLTLRESAESEKEMSTPHKHHVEMAEYAEDAAKHPKPWLLWEQKPCSREIWLSLEGSPRWYLGHDYRRKPEVVTVGRHSWPKPMVKMISGLFYVVTPLKVGVSSTYSALGLQSYIEAGAAHATMEAATQHFEALKCINKGDID